MIKKILTNKELYWTFLYQFITLVGGILLVKFLVVTLSITDYGYYSLVASVTALVVMLPFSAFMQGVVNRKEWLNKCRLDYFLYNIFFSSKQLREKTL